jgi:hypothetical protein
MRHYDNPVRAARRKAELCERNGSEEVRCIYCGITDPLVVRPRRIQGHHILSEARDSATAPVCLNCHAAAHESIRDSDIPMTCEKDPNAFARAVFLLLAVHLSMLAEACRRFAKKMEKK